MINFIINHSLKVFIIVCLIYPVLSYSQSNETFTLKGECNIQSGTAHLVAIDSVYYPSRVLSYDTNIVNGNFLFNELIEYPMAFRLFVMEKGIIVYHSDLFFVEKGFQTIKVNVHESMNLPEISNSTMEEYKSTFAQWFDRSIQRDNKYSLKRDSIKQIYKNELPVDIDSSLANEMHQLSNENDIVLLNYTKKHPDSYVALWKLADKIISGYKDIYDSIATSFSDKIKKTYTAKVLVEKLKTARVGRIGNPFPILYLSDSKKNIHVNAVHSNNRFTLIDFWFSDCSPCKAQFQELKKLYTNYASKGFNIIGISVDQRKDINKWQKTIDLYGLNWEQYLDIDNKETQKLSILAYPSNFLLDEKGIIIAKNITLTDLSKILENNLK